MLARFQGYKLLTKAWFKRLEADWVNPKCFPLTGDDNPVVSRDEILDCVDSDTFEMFYLWANCPIPTLEASEMFKERLRNML